MQQRCSELSLFRALSSGPRRTVRSPALPDGSRSWVLPKWGDARWTCSQPDVERFRGDRAGQVVALCDVTAEGSQGGEGRSGFYPFGDDRQAQAVAEVNDAVHDQGVAEIVVLEGYDGAQPTDG